MVGKRAFLGRIHDEQARVLVLAGDLPEKRFRGHRRQQVLQRPPLLPFLTLHSVQQRVTLQLCH